MLRVPYRTQPQSVAGLTISRRYPTPYEAWLPGLSPRGLIRGLMPSTEATFTRKGWSSYGQTFQGMNVSATGRRYTDELWEGQNDVAFLFIGYRDGTATGTTYDVIRKANTLTPIQEHSSGVTRVAIWDSAGLNLTTIANTSSLQNRVNAIAGVMDSTTFGSLPRGSIYCNGSARVNSVRGSGTLSSTADPLCFGADETGGGVATPWTILGFVAWSGGAVPSEYAMRELSVDPWSIFEKKSGFVFVGPPAAVGGSFQPAWAVSANTVITTGARAA